MTNFYTQRGELQRTLGSRTYPVGYTFDSQGRMTHMTNWSTYPSVGARVTQWNYSASQGRLESKRYPDATTGVPSSIGPDYTYTTAGRLLTRTWARGTPRIQTTYAYNNMGEIESVSYNDGVTPSTTYTYDRRGRQSTVTRNGITTTLSYNDANQLTSESYSGGTLNGLSVTLSRDSLLRRSGTSLGGVSGSIALTYGYDTASRLQSVSDGTHSATYAYIANSPLMDNIVFKQSTTTRMTTRKQYDKLNRMQSISFTTNSATAPGGSCNYIYNDVNQRVRVNLVDGSHWIYQYDKLGQVISGKRYWSDGTPIAGQQFEYAFDEIGNRNSTKAGGDSSGANLRSANYSPNRLNQYSSRTVPGAIDILGATKVTASVTVNALAATTRKAEYYHKEVSIANSSVAVWQSVSIMASEGGNNTTLSGNIFVPRTPESYTFDLDGNQITDGRWTYTWDGENRLTTIEALAGIPDAAKKKVECEYDWQSRRIRKKVYNWDSGSWILDSEFKFLYDGWNLLAIVDSANTATHSFTWGTDVSGTMQGAGGVGALIAMKLHTAPDAGTYFYAYDGNANVVALINAASGSNAAQYEYDSFHNLIRATGPLAFINPFVAATKFYDWETGLYYYGYRYYNPSTGRWLSRDPIEEYGGFNLYNAMRNNAVTFFDKLGQKCCVLTWPLIPTKAIGHSSLKCDSGVYVSMWGSSGIFGSPPSWQDEDEDKAQYPGVTPKQDCNDCLDEAKVKDWLDSARANANVTYNILSYACSEAVRDAIAAGLPEQKRPECPKNNCLALLTGVFWVVEDLLDPVCTANSPKQATGVIMPPMISQWFQNLGKNGCKRYKCMKCRPHNPAY